MLRSIYTSSEKQWQILTEDKLLVIRKSDNTITSQNILVKSQESKQKIV